MVHNTAVMDTIRSGRDARRRVPNRPGKRLIASGALVAAGGAGLAVWAAGRPASPLATHPASTGSPSTASPIPIGLKRPLHFPSLRPGQSCPASIGRPVANTNFGGVALGNGVVTPVLYSGADLRHGVGELTPTDIPGWLALQTLWVSRASYQGPFLVRAARLDRPGDIGPGGSPTSGPLFVPTGPTANTFDKVRTINSGTWVREAGCYGWQFDGSSFSDVVVVRAIPPVQP
jgi:hypothetical protein